MSKVPYQFLLIGMSGRGKTMAFRNMNPETTGFVNMESKPLPFINKFKHYSTPNNWQECYQKLIEYAKDSTIEVVILDSFSAYVDSLLKTARDTKKGFDIWNYYNEEIGKLQYLIKKYPKHLVVTGHYEWVEVEEGAIEKRLAVKGKEWKGMLEKDYTITNYCDMTVKEGKREYFITMNNSGKDSAKTPPIFLDEGEEKIVNDYNLFIVRVNDKLNK